MMGLATPVACCVAVQHLGVPILYQLAYLTYKRSVYKNAYISVLLTDSKISAWSQRETSGESMQCCHLDTMLYIAS